MNLKKIFLFLLITAVLFPLAAQQGKDVVLVVDTSSSMFSFYNDVGTYLSRVFLAENLSMGDTLHIISFGSKPRFEIARHILAQGDIETASARIWLLYPLDPNADSAGAISYTEQYTRSLQGERHKKVFFVSDSDLSSQVSAAAGRFPANTELHFIRAGSRMGSGQPVAGGGQSGAASSGSTSGTGSAAGSAGSSAAGSSAGTSGAVAAAGTAAGSEPSVSPDTSAGQTDQAGTQSGEQTASGSGNAAGGTAQGSGAEQGSGTAQSGGTAGAVAGGAATAGTGTGAGLSGFNLQSIPLPLIIAGALLLLLLLLFIIFRMRNLQSSPKKAMAQIASEESTATNNAALLNSYANQQAEASLQGPNRRYHYRTTNQFLTKPPMLNIFVEEQNTAIGRRNIHSLKKGVTYTVGGGNSDFLIFLVDFPARIGRLYFDGTNCTFTPLRSEYFPDLGSASVTECIGKPIRIISRKNYEVFFHFEPYKDPLIEMNQLLNSIKVPEPPSAVKGM